jgi:uncharacterized protein YwgA
MDLRAYVLAILNAADEVPGRTMMQKLVFLLARRRGEDLESYRPYFYGPYSDDVQAVVDGLVQAHLADESVTVFPAWDPDQFDAYQYRYRLTERGQQAAGTLNDHLADDARYLVERAQQQHAWTQAALATAAKLAYLQDLDPNVRTDEYVARAADFGWRVGQREVERGAALLSSLSEPQPPA